MQAANAKLTWKLKRVLDLELRVYRLGFRIEGLRLRV